MLKTREEEVLLKVLSLTQLLDWRKSALFGQSVAVM